MRMMRYPHKHRELQRLLIHGQLDRDMRKVVVDFGVWLWSNGGIKGRIGVEVRDGSDPEKNRR
jgi:hypothetical protein